MSNKLLGKTIAVAGLTEVAQVSTQVEKVIKQYHAYRDLLPISKRDLGRPYVAPKYDSNRNDQCPCGSGLKFKKCCINFKGE